jgi:hypothetical protein
MVHSSPQTVITILEPTWDEAVHLPANLGLLRIVRQAHPGARINFVGGARQIELMREALASDTAAGIRFVAHRTAPDRDTLPGDVYAAWRKLRSLPSDILRDADLIVLSSCTASCLNALTWMGLAPRCSAVLHGNANELQSWRSRNPVRRSLDLSQAFARFCGRGGKAVVLEERIRQSLGQQLPWLAPHLVCLPHPVLPEESAAQGTARALKPTIDIGFAGSASIAKGFPQFLELARLMQERAPGRFRFHAFGYLPPECRMLDQSALAHQAAEGLPRGEYVSGLRSMDYLFVWHQDFYYANAASGVVYDAINFGVPMIARRCAQVSAWQEQGMDVGCSFDGIEAAAGALASFDPAAETARYLRQQACMDQLRQTLGLPFLGAHFASTFPVARAGQRSARMQAARRGRFAVR